MKGAKQVKKKTWLNSLVLTIHSPLIWLSKKLTESLFNPSCNSFLVSSGSTLSFWESLRFCIFSRLSRSSSNIVTLATPCLLLGIYPSISFKICYFLLRVVISFIAYLILSTAKSSSFVFYRCIATIPSSSRPIRLSKANLLNFGGFGLGSFLISPSLINLEFADAVLVALN